MRKFIDVIYYHYYMWYELVSYTDNSKFYSAIFLAGTISFNIIGIIGIFDTIYWDNIIETWHFVLMFIIVLILISIYLFNFNRSEKILKEKPIFFKNAFITKLIVILYTLYSFLFLYFSALYLREHYPPV